MTEESNIIRIPALLPTPKPEIDLSPGELAELTQWTHGRLAEIEDRVHRAALLARFVPTDFEIREAGIYARVRRDNGHDGQVWRAILFPNRASVLPTVVGVFPYDQRDGALQAASDAVDALLQEYELADTREIDLSELREPS
jgi:hypothetical protein